MVDQQKKIIVTRFAPSPTGIFHLGSLRTALFNFLFARSLKGRFLLRIEDTDLQRSIPAEAERIEMFLKSFGLFFDSITFQKERFPIYLHYGNKLVASGLAYKSSSDKGRSVFFLNVNEFRKRFLLSEISFFDQLRKKEISFDLKHFGDFVIIKSDGSPGYNFSVVIDDYLAKVTDVLRGEEHIANMPKQLIIYRSFSFSPPRYFHLGLLVDAQKKKLSKRSADQTFSISKLMELGFLKEALLNFVAFLG